MRVLVALGRYKDDHSRQDRSAQWFWTVDVTPALHNDKCQWSVTCPAAMTLCSGSLELQRVPSKGTGVLFHIQALCIIMAGRKDWHECKSTTAEQCSRSAPS